jgi:hypothetical protein
MTHLELSLRDVMAHLLRCRDTVCPNPGFREQLERFGSSRGCLQNASHQCGGGGGGGGSGNLVALTIGLELDSEDDQPVSTRARICVPPPSAADVRASLRAAHGDALVNSDLKQVAARLCEYKADVAAQAASEWVFTANGKPVTRADVLATVTDDGDGNGPYVRVREEGDAPDEPGRRRSVCRPSELLANAEADWKEASFVPWDTLGFEAQAERLRARLQPLVDAGEAAPGGLAGLEWLSTTASK